ncbi:MAG: alpha-galactosidase, partial [Clostridia bacterium]|nr:alpha-galactosidase [Clostridia bacterium]
QRSDLVEVKTVFTAYEDSNALRIENEVKNISDEEIVLEEVSSFVLSGFGKKGIQSFENLYFTRFTQSHHAECQPIRLGFEQLGLFPVRDESQKRIAGVNIGSWSTKEELPQGLIEDTETGEFTMFQIEANSSWYYEISDHSSQYYLYLGGANLPFGGWSKSLKQGESYRAVAVALAFGKSLNETLGETSKYRRHISGKCKVDEHLPTVFNEYMHLSWDSPTEENTRKIAPIVQETGVEYYVIDCGWHNEEDGDKVYPFVGQWKESKKRFPNGVRATTDFIRSLGMKAGLWIEPEIIGIQCQEMLDFYDDSCFMQRNGKRLAVMGRHFLDFRAEKVTRYMTETIRRMVEDYGADYIKFDYNQDCGVGTDYLSFCAGEGLEECANAFLNWVDAVRKKFPNVLFEACSSGGMRMDYLTLSRFSICSTSDQTDYLKYPYIAGNILSGVLPEQAAVWSYPVGGGVVGKPFDGTKEWVRENISNDRIVMNMINSFLGRMHLASHLELLSDDQLALVREGVSYYNTLTKDKKTALPYFPNGFTRFGQESVAAGFETDDKIYLAVWGIQSRKVKVNIKTEKGKIKVGYPTAFDGKIKTDKKGLTVLFKREKSAVFLEIDKNK